MASPKRRKSVNFDLDTHRLIAEFGANKRQAAYSRIKRFLERNGFEHKQWSGYVSIERLSYAEVYVIIDDLMAACPWLANCANSFDITDFMAESDAMSYMAKRSSDVSRQSAMDDESLLEVA
jgi:virulence-associated protein VapD